MSENIPKILLVYVIVLTFHKYVTIYRYFISDRGILDFCTLGAFWKNSSFAKYLNSFSMFLTSCVPMLVLLSQNPQLFHITALLVLTCVNLLLRDKCCDIFNFSIYNIAPFLHIHIYR